MREKRSIGQSSYGSTNHIGKM